MTAAPSDVDERQLNDLHIALKGKALRAADDGQQRSVEPQEMVDSRQ
jgi:hypothetical protein